MFWGRLIGSTPKLLVFSFFLQNLWCLSLEAYFSFELKLKYCKHLFFYLFIFCLSVRAEGVFVQYLCRRINLCKVFSTSELSLFVYLCVRPVAPEHFPTAPWSRRSVVTNPQPRWSLYLCPVYHFLCQIVDCWGKQWRVLPWKDTSIIYHWAVNADVYSAAAPRQYVFSLLRHHILDVMNHNLDMSVPGFCFFLEHLHTIQWTTTCIHRVHHQATGRQVSKEERFLFSWKEIHPNVT